MNQENFHAPQAGQVVLAPGGYWAFIPAPLPPKIDYDPGLVVRLSRADAALSELSGLGRYMINPHLLIASYIRKEAVLSSRIEGTRAGIVDLLLMTSTHLIIIRMMILKKYRITLRHWNME